MSARTRWVVAIVGLLTVNVIAAVILMLVANNQGHSQVLPSYRTEAR